MPSRHLAALACCAVLAAAAAARAQEPSAPRIDGATPLVQIGPGAEICVCGRFPTPEAARALRIDGRPLEVVEPFHERVVTARLPQGLAPGLHAVTGAPEAGYGAADETAIRAVVVNDKVCRRPFKRRRVHFVIAGTTEPVKLRVRNLTPDRVRLAGGAVQEVTTSGGSDNQEVLKARMLRGGRWSVNAVLDAPRCPCADGRAEGLSQERVAELEAYLASAVAEVRAWFDGRARELTRRAERGALATGEIGDLVDELERRLQRVLETPDLAALRAWVEDELARERERLGGSGGTAPTRSAGFHRVSFTSPAPGVVLVQGLTWESFTGFLDRVSELFDRLEEVSDDLAVNLCVRSDPAREASLWLYPKRYTEGKRTSESDGVLSNLPRGLYCLLVTKPSVPWDTVERQARGGECTQTSRSLHGAVWAQAEVDLVHEANQYYTCELTKRRDSSNTCVKDPMTAGFACVRLPR